MREGRGRSNATQPRAPWQYRRAAGMRSGAGLECFALPVMKSLSSSQQILELDGALGLLVAILHDHRSIKRESPFGGFAFGYGARTGNDDRIFGNDQRMLRGGAIHLFAYDV